MNLNMQYYASKYFQNNICSIDFDTVDQVIDFIKKFNTSNSITNTGTNTGTDTIKIDPNDWKQPWNPCNPITQPYVTYEHKHDLDTYKVADPVPNPYTVTTANIKQVWTKNN